MRHTFAGLLAGSDDPNAEFYPLEAKLKWHLFDDAARLFKQGVSALSAGDKKDARVKLKQGQALMKKGGFFKLPYEVELGGSEHQGRENAYEYMDVLIGRLQWEGA